MSNPNYCTCGYVMNRVFRSSVRQVKHHFRIIELHCDFLTDMSAGNSIYARDYLREGVYSGMYTCEGRLKNPKYQDNQVLNLDSIPL